MQSLLAATVKCGANLHTFANVWLVLLLLAVAWLLVWRMGRGSMRTLARTLQSKRQFVSGAKCPQGECDATPLNLGQHRQAWNSAWVPQRTLIYGLFGELLAFFVHV